MDILTITPDTFQSQAIAWINAIVAVVAVLLGGIALARTKINEVFGKQNSRDVTEIKATLADVKTTADTTHAIVTQTPPVPPVGAYVQPADVTPLTDESPSK